mgnify:CR=1 FL=1|jgi:Uncharacterized protein conserved in bacteria
MKRMIICALTGLSMMGGAAIAEDFKPTKPVELVVHTGPGGGNDAFARGVLNALRRANELDVNFVVVNKAGGGSTSAMNYLREKTGDSHTIALYSSVWVTDGLVQEAAKTTLDDLTPIAGMVLEPALVVVKADSPYQTLSDFIKAAQAAPGKLKQSGGSVTARDAVVRYVLMNKTGAEWSFVSFPGGGERVSALLGGHVDMMIIEPSEAGELIRAGRIRAVAQVSDKRIEGFEDVPTIKEAGFDIPNVPQQRGLVGPPDMPAEAVKFYADLMKSWSEKPAYADYLKLTHLDNAYVSSSDLGQFFSDYTKLLREILQNAGVKIVR